MAQWKNGINYSSQENKIDEYFECLIECEDNDRVCKTVCTPLLEQTTLRILQRRLQDRLFYCIILNDIVFTFMWYVIGWTIVTLWLLSKLGVFKK